MRLKNLYVFSISIITTSCLYQEVIPSEQSKLETIKIDMIDNSDWKYIDGCGCSFYSSDKPPHIDQPETQKYFLAANDDKGWMNINGEVVELLKIKDETKYQGRIGEKYQQLYKSKDLSVEVECRATGYGDTHAVFCDANIIVKKGDQQKNIKCIGSCGC